MNTAFPASFTARREALAAVEQAAAQELAEALAAARKLEAEAHAKRHSVVEAARREAARVHDELERALALDVSKELFPLAEAFGDAPRSTAMKIAEVWRALNTRAVTELGALIDSSCLAFVFADVELVADKLAHELGQVGDAAGRASAAMLANTGAAEVDAHLRALEVAIAAHARQTPYGHPELRNAIERHVTSRGRALARDAFWASRKAAAPPAPRGPAPGVKLEEGPDDFAADVARMRSMRRDEGSIEQ